MLKIFAVFDVAVGAFDPPFFAQAKGQAARMFGDAVLSEKGPMAKHPGDYRLFYLGEFDEVVGALHPVAPEPLAIGSDFVVSAPAPLREVR